MALAGLLLVLLGGGTAGPARAQNTTDLFLSNDATTVRAISFRFVDTKTFEEEQLKEQIVTRAPGFWDRLRDVLPLLSYDRSLYRLDPIELQRDVVRLRRFYRRNGFLNPDIDYPASQLDTTENTLHVIFTIREGPPLVLQDIRFTGADGRPAVEQFPEPLQPRWRKLRDQIRQRAGNRFTETELVLSRGEVVRWLRDRGYAFAQVDAWTLVDSAAHVVDLHFTVDAGPMAYFGEVEVEGVRSVSERVVLRELPFRPGTRFSSGRLERGQRELFGLNLFRVALVEVPEDQPRDSTVTVRVRVREAEPRYVTTQIGWAREDGLSLQASWQHRNFFGGARQFTASAEWRTGLLALPQGDRQAVRSFSASLSLRQPYLFTTRLSVIPSPFFTWFDDENQLGTSFYEFGINTTWIYEFLPFRTLSVQHTFARAVPLGGGQIADTLNVYNRNIVTAGATLGRLNDFQNPRRGFLIRPQVEAAGLLKSGITYYKASLDLHGYLPLTRRVGLNARVTAGRLWPLGGSRNQQDPEVEFRFDPIRFYAGGSGDVRGWALQLLGAKFARPAARDTLYEAVGGLAKLSGSVEVRWPFPGLGSRWGLATFLDVGQISGALQRDADGRVLRDESGNPLLAAESIFNLDALKYGVGAGLRYQSPVGALRFDIAYKLNPDPEDLQPAAARYLFDIGARPDPPEERFLNRFNIHFSIGQTF
ncbi:BamA/TamA family outer membrane protein [Rhodocaloribacter litoris]|uniref:BamA/OMP85 family outer membrane protein n=1 Tax=Rhodocaloribacter litoris TaxID=2558931 RepID=UPI00141E43F9|nr:BamA/TamA family outer membrane protein [Rhodocaloribacter litoris]QXD14517.1 BamA/TamA family outer membrane protein [Rhodocaloribacter litoris]